MIKTHKYTQIDTQKRKALKEKLESVGPHPQRECINSENYFKFASEQFEIPTLQRESMDKMVQQLHDLCYNFNMC